MRPLQVYLDSSDYSNLSNPATATRFEPIRRQLATWVQDGLIEIRYSWSHIVELAHTQPEYRSAAQARATVLTQLCRGKALLYFTDLFSREAVNVLVPGSYATPGLAFVEDDRYYPIGIVDAQELAELPLTTVLAALEQGSRTQRRLMKKRLIHNGRLSAEGKRFVTEHLSGDPASIAAAEHGEGDWITSGRLQRILYGNTENREEAFAREIFQPERLIGLYLDAVPKGDGVRNTLRGPGAKLVSSMGRLRSFLAKAMEMFPAQVEKSRQTVLAAFASIRRSTIESMVKADSGALQGLGMRTEQMCARLVVEPKGAFPSLDCMLSAGEAWTRRATTDLRRKLRQSDFGDIAHATYIPYVDVWHGDKYFTDELRRLADDYNCTAVASPEELIGAIRARISR